ncbi:hypothetical protein [Ekhidna sp.]|uniref:hypothetical protein n=1 Tax=Ekhidna sp. TaxID=2608089 RepID=UPI003C7ADD02
MNRSRIHQVLYDAFLSERIKQKGERWIVFASIISFLIHVVLILLVDVGILEVKGSPPLLKDPIAAIYTPFSFILIYEVYLLVYHIPKSTSYYIIKQYEIITLIVIRALFKDLSLLDFSANWFQDRGDLQFTYDLITTLILFFLIYQFHKLNRKKFTTDKAPVSSEVQKLISRKEIMAIVLVPVFLLMASYSLGVWVLDGLANTSSESTFTIDINNIFFDEFFTVLILTDVLLLLISLFHTDRFSSVIRNSGFIVSTILLRLSFSSEGLLRNALIITAVLFGVLILLIYNQYQKLSDHS